MMSLKAFLSDRLTAAAEEIFMAVERTIIEYKEEMCRSKDLEISRLRMQLKLLKSESQSVSCSLQHAHHHHHHHHLPVPSAQQQQQQQQQLIHQSAPATDAAEPQHCDEEPKVEEAHEEGEEGSSVDLEHPEPSQIKKESQKSLRDFWMVQDAEDAEQLDDLESDMKDFISSPADMKSSLPEPTLFFHPFHSNGGEEVKDKPYCCSVCEKRFSNCSHLAAHIRTHTGERPYRCDICRKTFITTSALNRHQTIHTEGKPFVCTFCGKSFKWMESLGRHIRSVHRKDNGSVSAGEC